MSIMRRKSFYFILVGPEIWLSWRGDVQDIMPELGSSSPIFVLGSTVSQLDSQQCGADGGKQLPGSFVGGHQIG